MTAHGPSPKCPRNQRSAELAHQVRQWVDSGVLGEELDALVLKASHDVLEEFDDMPTDPCDLARDFLVWLRGQGGFEISTEIRLKKQLHRYFVRANEPAGHELWTIISSALRGLAGEDRARRLDKPWSENNENLAVWTGAPPESDDNKLDLGIFADACESIPVLPKARKKETSYGAERKVLSPTEARELTMLLLTAAAGPILMTDLFQEAKKHAVLPSVVPFPEPKDADAETKSSASPPEDVAPADEEQLTFADALMIEEESSHRAVLLWDKLDKIGLLNLLCGYFIPRYLGAGARLADFGTPQRVDEQVARIESALRDEFFAFEVAGNPQARQERLRDELVIRTVMRLQEKCTIPAA